MTMQNNGNDEPSMGMRRGRKRSAEFGEIAAAYIDELGNVGEEALLQRLQSASDSLINEILAKGHRSVSRQNVLDNLRFSETNQSSSVRIGQLATAATRSTRSAAVLAWSGEWDGTEYMVVASGNQQDLVFSSTREPRRGPGESVTIQLPDGEQVSLQIGEDGESGTEVASGIAMEAFSDMNRIEVRLSSGVVINLVNHPSA